MQRFVVVGDQPPILPNKNVQCCNMYGKLCEELQAECIERTNSVLQRACREAGGEEEDDAQAQEDHEDVTTKEDAKPDSLVSAYWETIGTTAYLPYEHQCTVYAIADTVIGIALCCFELLGLLQCSSSKCAHTHPVKE